MAGGWTTLSHPCCGWPHAERGQLYLGHATRDGMPDKVTPLVACSCLRDHGFQVGRWVGGQRWGRQAGRRAGGQAGRQALARLSDGSAIGSWPFHFLTQTLHLHLPRPANKHPPLCCPCQVDWDGNVNVRLKVAIPQGPERDYFQRLLDEMMEGWEV